MKCGNTACMKLVDPDTEHKISLDDAGLIATAGIGLIVIGVPVSLITLALFICPDGCGKKDAADTP